MIPFLAGTCLVISAACFLLWSQCVGSALDATLGWSAITVALVAAALAVGLVVGHVLTERRP